MNATTIFILAPAFILMMTALVELGKLKHDIVYGKVEVREQVYKCEKWKFTR